MFGEGVKRKCVNILHARPGMYKRLHLTHPKCPSSMFWHRKWCWCVTIPIVRWKGNVLSLSVHQGRGVPRPLVPGPLPASGPRSCPWGWGGGHPSQVLAGGRGYLSHVLAVGWVGEGYPNLFFQVPSQALDPGPFWVLYPSQVLAREGGGVPQPAGGPGGGGVCQSGPRTGIPLPPSPRQHMPQTGCTAGGTPLALTQEDFLVLHLVLKLLGCNLFTNHRFSLAHIYEISRH